MDPIDRLTYEIGVAPDCWRRARSYFVLALAALRDARTRATGEAPEIEALIDILHEAAAWSESQLGFAIALRELAAAEFGLRMPAAREDAVPKETVPATDAVPPSQLH